MIYLDDLLDRFTSDDELLGQAWEENDVVVGQRIGVASLIIDEIPYSARLLNDILLVAKRLEVSELPFHNNKQNEGAVIMLNDITLLVMPLRRPNHPNWVLNINK